jgi:sulfatase modifying factor 1
MVATSVAIICAGCANALDVRKGRPEPHVCATTADCGPDSICRDGICTAACANSDRCALGESCTNGACVPDGTTCTDEPDRCDGLTPQTCGPNGVWVPKQDAPCEEQCKLGDCARAPSCDGSPLCGGVSCCASDLVPGGEFELSDDTHRVRRLVSPFALDRFEVTNVRFWRFIAAYDSIAAKDMAAMDDDVGGHPRVPGSGWQRVWSERLPTTSADLQYEVTTLCGRSMAEDTMPVRCVTWYMAFAFCVWDEGRLPTEAEWAFAASAGPEGRAYPWSAPGDVHIDRELACYREVGTDPQAPDDVALHSLGAGKFGHYNLAGNVSEWILDVGLQDLPLGPCAAHNDTEPDAAVRDCVELTTSSPNRGIRGGSYLHAAAGLKNTVRNYEEARKRSASSGFRCARDPR